MNYSCSFPSSDTVVIQEPYPIISDDSTFNFTHEDSIQMDKVNDMYKAITISKRWQEVTDSTQYISIHKNYLDINLIYEIADSSAVLEIIDVANYPDSVSFKVAQGDTWTFENQKQQRGIWTITNPRTKKRIVIGKYFSRSNK